MADITIASLKASLLEKQSLLTQKVDELNSFNAELTALVTNTVVNEFIVNNYTPDQYLSVHSPVAVNSPGWNFVHNVNGIQVKVSRAIALKTILIPKLNTEIANLKIEIDTLSKQIASFQVQDVKNTLANAAGAVADGFKNNLPLIIIGIIVIGGIFYWIRNYFKKKQA